MKNIKEIPPEQQIPQLLETERNSWQRIYNYDVSEDNLVTITGVKKNFASLTEISVPKEIKHKKVVGIGAFAFKNSKATIIHLPDTLEFIEKAAFYHCESLIYVNIPNTVTRIGANAFDGCSSLMDIKLPVNLTRIEDKTFNGCVGIDSITINDKVVSIGDSAFYGCENLTTIYGASAVKMIKINAFKVQNPVETSIITDNEYVKQYNWTVYGRNPNIVDDPEMLDMVHEDNRQLQEEYEKKMEELKNKEEQQITSKISKQFNKIVERVTAKKEPAEVVEEPTNNGSENEDIGVIETPELNIFSSKEDKEDI